MKVVKTIFFLIFAVIVSCQTNRTVKNQLDTHSKKAKYALQGEWQLLGKSSDNDDGKIRWTTVKTFPYEFVTFASDGTMDGTVFPEYVDYTMVNDTTLSFKTKNKIVQNFRYVIRTDTLEINTTGTKICKEGCHLRFVSALD